MNWLTLIPTLISVVGSVRKVIDAARSNEEIAGEIAKIAPSLLPLLKQLGLDLFPDVPADLQPAAAAVIFRDPELTKKLQAVLNSRLSPSPNLAVDGAYGPLTRDAVKRAQQQVGATADGWAGHQTYLALRSAGWMQ